MKLLVVLVILLVTSGCTSMLLGASGESAGGAIGQDNRSTTQVSADDRISTTIRSKFAADSGLGSLRLRVETRHGVVTLRGTASSFTQRDRSHRIARDVKGVLRVDNQISVNSNQERP